MIETVASITYSIGEVLSTGYKILISMPLASVCSGGRKAVRASVLKRQLKPSSSHLYKDCLVLPDP